MKLIDAHIHLDHYKDEEIKRIMEGSTDIEALISVSFHLESCKKNLQLSQTNHKVKPAFGYHPEQPLPTEKQQRELYHWMAENRSKMIAIGEVGLPFYLRQEQNVSTSEYQQYMELLENFIRLSKKWELPIVLHAVYDDAPMVCDLLEKYSVYNAHFHWFKGDSKTIERMCENGYLISITPDVLYEQEIQQLVQMYPIERLMVETDGPWPFEGPFEGKMTHPNMMIESIRMIGKLKHLSAAIVAERILQNTKEFYQI
jgi:TatD DNase family protein